MYNEYDNKPRSQVGRFFVIAIFFFFLGYIVAEGVCRLIDKLDQLDPSDNLNTSRFNPKALKKVLGDPNLIPAVVIGGGSAGYTAATYLAQAGYKTVMFTGKEPGGAIAKTNNIRNWPGSQSTTGEGLVQTWKDQAINNGVIIKSEIVTEVDFSEWPFILSSKDLVSGKESDHLFLSAVIATGAKPKTLGIPGEQIFWGRGVTNCAICDSDLTKGKTAVVVGGGDAAISEAHTLAAVANKVYIIVRKDKMLARDKVKDSVLAMPNVEVLFNSQVKEVLGDKDGITSVKVDVNGKIREIETSGLFLAIGSTPNIKLFDNQLEVNKENGCLKVSHGQQTSEVGVFAAGDITTNKHRQAIIAAGDGCRASLQALEFLKSTGANPQMFNHPKQEPATETTSKSSRGKKLKSKQKKEIAQKLEKKEGIFGRKFSKATSSHEPETPAEPKLETIKKITPAPEPTAKEGSLIMDINSESEFSKVLEVAKKTDKIILLDFFGTWCRPCKLLHEVLEVVAAQQKNRVIVGQVDVDIARSLATTYKIRGVPTMILFNSKGDELNRVVGSQDLQEINRIIDVCCN